MKFCKDCKHARFFQYRLQNWHCFSPKLGLDLVTGDNNESPCFGLRHTDDPLGCCGQDGRWFEPKDPTTF